MRTRRMGVGAALMLGIALVLPGIAARAADPRVPAGPPHVEDVLKAMSQFLAKQKGYSYHAEVVFDQILPRGPKIQLSGAVDVTVARPGNLYVDYRDDVTDRVIWLENGRLTLLDPFAGTYAQIDGPKDIDGMVAKLEKEYGTALPLGELAEKNADAALTRGVDLAHYVGVHNVEGIYCHHVVLQRPDLDIQVFVEVGEKPLPRKIVFEFPGRPGSPQYTASITDWKLEPPEPAVFEAKLPKEAARIDFLPLPTKESGK